MRYALAAFVVYIPLQALHAEERTVRDGVFASSQAERGRVIYEQTCALGCHIENLMGSGPSLNLRGYDFLLRWADFSLAELLELMNTTMPKDENVRLTDKQYVDVIAYILSANGFPAGTEELADRAATLDSIYITDSP